MKNSKNKKSQTRNENLEGNLILLVAVKACDQFLFLCNALLVPQENFGESLPLFTSTKVPLAQTN